MHDTAPGGRVTSFTLERWLERADAVLDLDRRPDVELDAALLDRVALGNRLWLIQPPESRR